MVARHCVTCVGCTEYSLANCETVFSPTRASNPTLALKAALCRLRFAFISLLFLIYSRLAKVYLNPWSNFRGPPLYTSINPLIIHSPSFVTTAFANDSAWTWRLRKNCALVILSVRCFRNIQRFIAVGINNYRLFRMIESEYFSLNWRELGKIVWIRQWPQILAYSR